VASAAAAEQLLRLSREGVRVRAQELPGSCIYEPASASVAMWEASSRAAVSSAGRPAAAETGTAASRITAWGCAPVAPFAMQRRDVRGGGSGPCRLDDPALGTLLA